MSNNHRTASVKTRFDSAANGSRPGKGRPPPVSIRFNEAERALLSGHAKDEPLGPYIKRCVLNAHQAPPKPRRKAPSKQTQAIARTLRGLGVSGVSGVLGTLLLAVEEGRLPIDRDDEVELRRAAARVAAIRQDLVAALNVRESTDA